MNYIDLTHTFTPDMPVYPGDPKSTLEQVAEISKDTYNDHKLSTVMHVGTHMDAPLHMIENGKRIDELNVENFFGRGVVIDTRGKMVIDASVIGDTQIDKGSIVLLYTGFGGKYKDEEYFTNFPEITEDFANKLVELGVNSVGMDISGPDHDDPWPIHKIFLGHDITILENLVNLDQLLDVGEFEVVALPAKFQADAAPVRVIAKINQP